MDENTSVAIESLMKKVTELTELNEKLLKGQATTNTVASEVQSTTKTAEQIQSEVQAKYKYEQELIEKGTVNAEKKIKVKSLLDVINEEDFNKSKELWDKANVSLDEQVKLLDKRALDKLKETYARIDSISAVLSEVSGYEQGVKVVQKLESTIKNKDSKVPDKVVNQMSSKIKRNKKVS